MTFGSLFSGIGGMDLGLERAGMRCLWMIEKDPFRRKVLAKRFPDVELREDVRNESQLPTVDLIAGGWPCQPFSDNGKRKGGADKRDMWPAFFRIICEVRPRWLVAENVPGVLSIENGRYFGRVLQQLASVGYDAEWRVLSAAQFGAPHQRNRLFLVAHAIEIGWIRILRDPIGGSTEAHHTWKTYDPLGNVWDRISQIEKGLGQSCVLGSNDGLAHQVDRLASVGEAVVPQITEWIGRRILEKEASC